MFKKDDARSKRDEENRMKKIWLLIIVLLLGGIGIVEGAAPSKIVGANVDKTPPGPVPACTTYGFSIDATNTLPAGQNSARMVRVDRSGITTVGYVLTSQATGYTVYVFDLSTMVVVGSVANTMTGYVNNGRLQGDVGVDGKLYVFNEVTNANLACPLSNCVVMSRWSGVNLEASALDATGAATGNIDDARESGSQFLAIVSVAGTSLRQFRTYNKSTLGFTALGTLTGVSAFGHIGRAANSRLYAAVQSTVANPNMWAFASETPTADNTGRIVYSVGHVVNAISPIDKLTGTDLVAFDSDNSGGVNGERVWATSPGVVLSGPTLFGTANYATFEGSFYDSLNNKSFLFRTTTGSDGFAQRITPGVTPFTSEQVFGCGVQCTHVGGVSSSQIADYSQRYARMYIGSVESPARLTRIKVCATGGP